MKPKESIFKKESGRITRRQFLKRVGVVTGGALTLGSLSFEPTTTIYGDGTVALPTPVIGTNSLELCLNSRLSYHGGWNGTASDQWLSNVLWATGKAPVVGSYRTTYVTKQDGKYLYNPGAHTLTYIDDSNSSTAAFMISYDRELDFDAGVAYMFALLAGVSLWNGTESQLGSCPMNTNLYFGKITVRGLTSEISVQSSNSSLPLPSTQGVKAYEEIVAGSEYVDRFSAQDLSLQELSQILWAAYGCSAHIGVSAKPGLTVPSYNAWYLLTTGIYVCSSSGVFLYNNRNPSDDLWTTDHRLDTIKSVDVREDLRAGVPRLPQDAPCYLILCLEDTPWYAQLETGFAAGNALLQATALGLGCHAVTNLTPEEQTGLRNATGIPSTKVPWVVVSLGKPLPVCKSDMDDDQDVDGSDVALWAEGNHGDVSLEDLAGDFGKTDCS